MADPFLGEIRMFPYNFAPSGWAFCNGALLPLSQNTALFSLLGTYYGGDGRSTFALPDLQGNAPMHWGQGQGLTAWDLGTQAGVESVTLLVSEIPVHTHAAMVSPDTGDLSVPNPTRTLGQTAGAAIYAAGSQPLSAMAFQGLPPAGGGLPHNNMQPYLTLNFCIAMRGVFPPRH